MAKVLLLDFDGVINQSRYFSEIYSEEFGVDKSLLIPFFENNKDTLNIGKGDLKKELGKVLNTWKWKSSVDDLINYWFNSDFSVDERFIDIVSELKNKGIQTYLATDQEKYRAEFIWNQKGLKNWMVDRFISCFIGCTKSDPNFFEFIIKQLKVSPSEITFFDDSENKVNTAKTKGINGHVYTDFDSFLKVINEIYK